PEHVSAALFIEGPPLPVLVIVAYERNSVIGRRLRARYCRHESTTRAAVGLFRRVRDNTGAAAHARRERTHSELCENDSSHLSSRAMCGIAGRAVWSSRNTAIDVGVTVMTAAAPSRRDAMRERCCDAIATSCCHAARSGMTRTTIAAASCRPLRPL